MDRQTLTLMHFKFTTDGRVVHYMHQNAHLTNIYNLIPNLYCVTFLRDSVGGRYMIGGLFLKTHSRHATDEFDQEIRDAASECPELSGLFDDDVIVGASPIQYDGEGLPRENDMMCIVAEQYMKRAKQGEA